MSDRLDLVGILPITPDSFSDGGKYTNVDNAPEQATLMLNAGESIIDVSIST